ncbi:MAG: hypothetical protein JO322_10265 [Candidatus Eremiobacteraeota bacterium]|nr:hypothetical protein [Candidatus Eremiobacteraeota bacterium]
MTFARAFAFITITTLLAACGGGGGTSGPTGGGGGTVTPPGASGSSMGQQSVQRADAQNSLAAAQAVREASGGSATPFARQRNALRAAVAQARRSGFFDSRHPIAMATSAPGCTNGSVTSTASGPNGSTVITVSTYYDSVCTEIESTIVWTATQSGNTVSGPATETLYSSSGAVTETANAQITLVYNSSQVLTGLSILMTNVVNNGKPEGEIGVGCSAASTTSVSCGVAVAADVYTSSLEQGANVSFTATTNSSGAAISMQASAYQSALDGLSISAATLPDWTISPASAQTGSVSITGSESGSDVSLTASDSANGGAAAISGAVNGTLNGTLTRTDTGATVATFTVDQFGNGTLTYGNGTQVQIVNYAVQG